MNATKITSQHFLDILFDGRNKSYGAYEHRVSYEKRVRNSVIGTASIAALFIGGYLISSNLRAAGVVEKPRIAKEVVLEHVEIPEEKPMVTPPPPARVEPPAQTATQKFTAFQVTDKPVDPSEEPPRMEDLDPKKSIGVMNRDGAEGANADPGIEGLGKGDGVVTPPPMPEKDRIETFVEIMPQFPGGEEALNKFLRNNMRYPHLASEQGIEGTVFITFVVGTDGDISDIKTVGARKGGGLEEEAIRVVNKMPKWKPGKQNSRPVRVQFNLPIRFQMEQQ